MGLFSNRKPDRVEQRRSAYQTARDEIWTREIARLGKEEFYRRRQAIGDHELGRTGPSGFEEWDRQLDADVVRRASELAG